MSSRETCVRAAAERLAAAARPAILVGPEATGAVDTVLELATLLGAAVLTTPDALSLVCGSRSCGVFSFGASARAKRAIARADLVLAVSALGEFACRLGEAFTEHELVQVTEHVANVGRNCRPDVALVGPVAQTLDELRRALRLAAAPRAPWFDEAPPTPPEAPEREGVIHPVAAIRAVHAALPERVRVCLDVTSGALHAYEHFRLTPEQRVFSSIENSACMAEALMASLGVRLASGLPTLALVGDWGQCMAPAELHTAVELGLARYVVVVWANGGGAFIGEGVRQQRIAVSDSTFRFHRAPDFASVARGYGARGVRVTDAAALEREVFAGLRGTGPVLVEARIDPDTPVPAGDRFLTLGESHASLHDERPAPSRVALRKPASEP